MSAPVSTLRSMFKLPGRMIGSVASVRRNKCGTDPNDEGAERQQHKSTGSISRVRQIDSLFELVAAHATDLIVTLSPDGTLRYISEACRAILARRADDLVGCHFADLVVGEYWSRGQFEAVISEGHPGRREIFRCARADGTFVWLEADFQPVRGLSGHVTEILGVLRDITERRSAEDRLSQSEERFRGSFASAAHGMALVSIEGRWLEVNKALCAIVGYSEQELLTTDFQTITHPDDLDADLSFVRRLLDGEIGHYQMDKRYIHRAGHIIWIRLSVSLARDTLNRPLHFVSQILDITAAREAEEALRRAKDEAERASTMKSAFLATMSHEIRTPMNGVIGFVDVLLRSDLTAEQRRVAGLLRDAGASLLAIINDILDLSKIEAGRLQLETVPLRLADLVEGAVSIVRSEAEAKRLRLICSLDSGLPEWVEGDEVRLRQILLNLLSNAIKFTDLGAITLSVEARSGLLTFAVEDTGSGIAAENLPLLFQDFYQLDRSMTRRCGGTGLGLAICKRLVESMPQGRMGVTSELGRGSRFWFEVALPRSVAPARAAAIAIPPADLPPARILVAEDNQINQTLIEYLLKPLGHDVIIASDGRAAVAAFEQSDFDLVLMDMEMPHLDGISAARLIRAIPGPKGATPILALTANAMPEQAARCLAAGMNEHMSKPIDRTRLLASIERWTRDRQVVPTREPSAPSGVLNLDIVGDLEAHIGRDNVARLIGAFRAQIDDAVAALAGAEPKQIAAHAHKLVSTAGTLGFVELMTSSRSLMQAIGRSDDDIAPLVASMQTAAVRANAAAHARWAA